MKRRQLATAILTVAMFAACSFTSAAAYWDNEYIGEAAYWKYAEDDGAYVTNAWRWIGGRCYYFDANGFKLRNTITPDGYTVDDIGAWTVDGQVQTSNINTEQPSFERITLLPDRNGIVKTGDSYTITGKFIEPYIDETTGSLGANRIIQENVKVIIDANTKFDFENMQSLDFEYPLYQEGDTVATWFERYYENEYLRTRCFNLKTNGNQAAIFYGIQINLAVRN